MEPHLLEPVGVTGDEETVYTLLVEGGPIPLAEIARVTAVSLEKARRILGALEEKGLVRRSANRPLRFLPAQPNLALEALILRRQEELQKVRLAAAALGERYQASVSPDSPLDVVDVVTGRAAIGRQFEQLVRGATREVVVFSKPPYADPSTGAEFEALRRGIRYRILYARVVLDHPEYLRSIEESLPEGEEARFLPEVPLKLVIVDGKHGLLPLARGLELEGALLLRPSPLVDALAAFFEVLWGQGLPFPVARSGEAEAGSGEGLSADDATLLTLLLAGLTDDAIAKRLGIARRTVQRRLSRMAAPLGARNRLQLVLQAARRGFL